MGARRSLWQRQKVYVCNAVMPNNLCVPSGCGDRISRRRQNLLRSCSSIITCHRGQPLSRPLSVTSNEARPSANKTIHVQVLPDFCLGKQPWPRSRHVRLPSPLHAPWQLVFFGAAALRLRMYKEHVTNTCTWHEDGSGSTPALSRILLASKIHLKPWIRRRCPSPPLSAFRNYSRSCTGREQI